MIWKTAWKNVWRNRVRSLVVIISVTIGIFGGVFAVAVMNAAIKQRVDAALNEEIGHVQIDHPGFRDNFDINLTIPREEVTRVVTGIPGVVAVSPRILLSGMANTAAKSVGVQIVGIDPEQEAQTLRLHETTIPGTGEFLSTGNRSNLAYIGQDLAKELNIIRYIIDDTSLERLREQQVPEEILERLFTYKGQRFSSERAFKNEMKRTLTLKEERDYGRLIRQAAWSFRERSKLTLTFLDRNQVQTGAVFRIAGIYDIKNNMFEKAQVFVTNEDLSRLTGLDVNEIHQVILRLQDMESAVPVAAQLSREFPDLEVRDWKVIDPLLAMMTDMVRIYYVVFMAIILAALAFGIVNTMLMVVLERTKELGMLTAIGMNKRRVFSMIMLESIFLSLVGGVIGMGISKLMIAVTARNGINFASYEEGFEAMGFTAHIYPEISVGFFMMVVVLIIITGVLSSIYPALKALRLDPAEALRTE